MPRRVLFVLLFVAGLAGLTILLLDRFAGAFDFDDDGPRLVYLLLLAGVIGSGILLGGRIGLGGAAKAIAAWTGIGLLLILGYSYRADLTRLWNRVAGELAPSSGITGTGTVAYRRAGDGHFYVDARVNGRRVRFLVDTGATTTGFDAATARAVGIDPASLDYSVRVRTASGTVRAAPARLAELAIGPVVMRQVRVLVMPGNRGLALLGMNVLKRFGSYEIKDGVLTLRR